MTMGGNKLFVDTNVLVYAVVIESPFHVVARLRFLLMNV